MKILKRILIGLVAVIAIVLIAAAVMKKDYSVRREITINKPRTEVFNYVKMLKNQDNFSVWNKMDPDMKKEFKGTDGQVGFVSSWDSKVDSVGAGSQEIKKIEDGKRVDMELHFMRPFESTSQAFMITDDAGENITKVTWGFEGSMPYPMNIMLLFMDMDKAVGKDFQKGLENLKEVLEKK